MAILLLMPMLPASEQPGHAFEYFEHRYIGNLAFQDARDQLLLEGHKDFALALDHTTTTLFQLAPEPTKPSKLESDFFNYMKKIPVGFGDLAALAGDHAESPEILAYFLDNKTEEAERFIATRRQWENICNWLYQASNISSENRTTTTIKADTCYNDLLHNITPGPSDSPAAAGTISVRSQGYIPPRLEIAEFEKLGNFVSLLTNNKSHFPRHSWSAYRKHHRAALNSALCYYDKKRRPEVHLPRPCVQDESSRSHLTDAIVLEGFAQHFLQDSFASGHIGASYKSAGLFSGVESKKQLQHAHDTLNMIGIEVYFPFFNISQIKDPWIAFGDQHLLIPESSLHRKIILHIATQSILEVLQAAATGPKSAFCKMCSDDIFPIPKDASLLQADIQASVSFKKRVPLSSDYDTRDLTDWTMRDARVPPLSLEGWKVLATWGLATGPFKDGGNFFDFGESFRIGRPRQQSQVGAITLELGYVRSTEPYIPNYLGVGFLTAPGSGRTSIYPISFGYWRNPAGYKWGVGIRANLGLRIEEPNTERNHNSSRLVGGELSIPIDLMFEVYPPFALYIRYEIFSVYTRGLGDDPGRPSLRIDSLFGNGAVTISIVGARFDLAGIL